MEKLFVDDLRDPPSDDFVVARSAEEAIKLIEKHGMPKELWLDHDLGEGKMSGYDFAKWLVQKDHENDFKFIPENTRIVIHSANPVGAGSMIMLLGSHSQKTNKNLRVVRKIF